MMVSNYHPFAQLSILSMSFSLLHCLFYSSQVIRCITSTAYQVQVFSTMCFHIHHFESNSCKFVYEKHRHSYHHCQRNRCMVGTWGMLLLVMNESVKPHHMHGQWRCNGYVVTGIYRTALMHVNFNVHIIIIVPFDLWLCICAITDTSIQQWSLATDFSFSGVAY